MNVTNKWKGIHSIARVTSTATTVVKNPFHRTGKAVIIISCPQMRKLSPREAEQTAHKQKVKGPHPEPELPTENPMIIPHVTVSLFPKCTLVEECHHYITQHVNDLIIHSLLQNITVEFAFECSYGPCSRDLFTPNKTTEPPQEVFPLKDLRK